MKIIFPVQVYQKFRSYVNSTPYEISGLGKISIVEDIITIEDVRIFKQYVTDGETILQKDSLGKFYDEIIKQEGDLSKWKLWWHSHAQHDVFFSAIDEKTITDFDNETHDDNWMLSIVSNHKAEASARIDIFSPIRCTISEIDWQISFEDKIIKIAALDEIAEKVVPGAPPKKWKKDIIDFSKRRIHLLNSGHHNSMSAVDLLLDENGLPITSSETH